MTKLALPPGVSLPVAQRRLTPGYMQPVILGDGTDGTTSLRARATAVASATPHTKGAWTEVFAATTSDVTYLMLSLTAATASNLVNSSTLLDIGIGGAGSEVVIVPNLAVGYQLVVNSPLYEIPVAVPVGSRIAIRCQSAVVSQAVAVQLALGQLPNGRRAPSAIVDIGTDLASSKGVTVTVPGSVNTKSAWTQIIAATAEPYDALIIGVQGAADTIMATSVALLDVGYGASGAEVVLAPDLPLTSSANEAYQWGLTPLIPCRLPKGARLAARWQTANTGNSMDMILYGVRP